MSSSSWMQSGLVDRCRMVERLPRLVLGSLNHRCTQMDTDGFAFMHSFIRVNPCASVVSNSFFYISSERSSPERLGARSNVGAVMILPVSRRRRPLAHPPGPSGNHLPLRKLSVLLLEKEESCERLCFSGRRGCISFPLKGFFSSCQ